MELVHHQPQKICFQVQHAWLTFSWCSSHHHSSFLQQLLSTCSGFSGNLLAAPSLPCASSSSTAAWRWRHAGSDSSSTIWCSTNESWSTGCCWYKFYSASRIEQDSSFWVRISQLGSRFWSTFSTHHPTVSTLARLPGCTLVLPGVPPAMEGAILHGGVGEKKNSKQQRGTTKIEQYTARKTNNDYFFREHVSFGGKLLGYFIWILSPETIWTKKNVSPWQDHGSSVESMVICPQEFHPYPSLGLGDQLGEVVGWTFPKNPWRNDYGKTIRNANNLLVNLSFLVCKPV